MAAIPSLLKRLLGRSVTRKPWELPGCLSWAVITAGTRDVCVAVLDVGEKGPALGVSLHYVSSSGNSDAPVLWAEIKDSSGEVRAYRLAGCDGETLRRVFASHSILVMQFVKGWKVHFHQSAVRSSDMPPTDRQNRLKLGFWRNRAGVTDVIGAGEGDDLSPVIVSLDPFIKDVDFEAGISTDPYGETVLVAATQLICRTYAARHGLDARRLLPTIREFGSSERFPFLVTVGDDSAR